MIYDVSSLNGKEIVIGQRGENLVTTIQIDVTEWLKKWPGAALSILVRRPGDVVPYVAVTSVSGNILKWPVTKTDTANAGTGKIEVRATSGGAIKKSVVATIGINPCILCVEDEQPPELDPAVADLALEAAIRAENAAAQAETARWNNVYSLMDNGDFRVNQRGSASYTADGYTVDRWGVYHWASGATGTVNLIVQNDGVVLSGGVDNADTASSCYLYQKIDCARFAGKTFTAAVYIDSLSGDGTGLICAKCNDSSVYIKGEYLKAGITLVNFTLPSNATNMTIFVGNHSSHGGKGSITASIKWVAMYEGAYTADTLPAYQPKGYAAELSECQRYYYQSWKGSSCKTTDGIIILKAVSNVSTQTILLPQEMRVNPTVTFYGTDGTSDSVQKWADSTKITGIETRYKTNKSFSALSQSGAFTKDDWYYFHYSVSADL